MKKRFIEWDLPLAEISKEAAREKNIRHGHPSTLHVWWARKPLASSRATNFAALIDLPDTPAKRKGITELIKKITPWEAVKNGNDGNIKKAQQMIEDQWGDQPPKVLDPFAGGGSIPLEAARLGCETYSIDCNPVAVLIERVTVEWPQRLSIMIDHPDKRAGIDGIVEEVSLLTYLVEKWTGIVLEQVKREIANYYPPDPIGSVPVGYVWARTIPCQNPSCGAEIPLVNQFWLAKREKKKVAYRVVTNKETKSIDFEILEDDLGDFDPARGTVSGGTVLCPLCNQSVKGPDVRRLALNGKMGERMTVIVTRQIGKAGKSYRVATEADMSAFKAASSYLKEKASKWQFLESPLPDERMRTPDGNEVRDSSGPFFVHLQPVLYGMPRFRDMFNARQKLALMTFVEKTRLAFPGIKEDCHRMEVDKLGLDLEETSKAILCYLAVIVDEIARFTTSLNIWKADAEAVVHLFGRQAIPMSWGYFENNPIGDHGGTYAKRCREVVKVVENTRHTTGFITTELGSAASLPFPDNSFDAVFTDPPYYDNVPYADISDFFYVWLKRTVGDIMPDLFITPTVPRAPECVENESLMRRASSIGQDEYEELSIKGKEHFNDLLTKCFAEIHRVLKTDGIATIVYAHKSTAGWETMLGSLVSAGLVITASWPIRTEMKARLRSIASAALASSIYMVCRKIKREEVGFFSEIQPKITEKVEAKLQQFWNEGIAGGDFFISAIGPGMEIFSKYERVEKLSGEPVTTSELLDYIRSVSTDFIVRKLLVDGSLAKIDGESYFYLAYRWTYLDNTVEYDDARKLASASGVSLDELWRPGGFVKKSGSKISVLGPKERGEVDSIQNMVDVMHKCLLLWEKGDKDEIAELLTRTGFREDPAFKQFCQAVAECLLEGNKEKQLLEGFLMGVDDYARLKVRARKSQKDLRQFGGG